MVFILTLRKKTDLSACVRPYLVVPLRWRIKRVVHLHPLVFLRILAPAERSRSSRDSGSTDPEAWITAHRNTLLFFVPAEACTPRILQRNPAGLQGSSGVRTLCINLFGPGVEPLPKKNISYKKIVDFKLQVKRQNAEEHAAKKEPCWASVNLSANFRRRHACQTKRGYQDVPQNVCSCSWGQISKRGNKRIIILYRSRPAEENDAESYSGWDKTEWETAEWMPALSWGNSAVWRFRTDDKAALNSSKKWPPTALVAINLIGVAQVVTAMSPSRDRSK